MLGGDEGCRPVTDLSLKPHTQPFPNREESDMPAQAVLYTPPTASVYGSKEHRYH